MILRKAKTTDSGEIAELYKRIFDTFHLTSHYPVPLLSKYFQNLLGMNEFCYVMTENDNLLGFLIGGTNIKTALKIFARENLSVIIREMCKHPRFILKGVAQKLTKNKQSKADMRLFIIGTDIRSGKKGIGSSLLAQFERDIIQAGFNLYGLNVRTENFSAQQFYINRGFILEFKSNDSLCFTKTLNHS